MRNELIGLGAMVLVATMATAACSDNNGSAEAASTTGGTSSSGGNAPSTGGQQSTGGSATGGSATGGSATGGSATGGAATGGSGSATGGAATGGSGSATGGAATGGSGSDTGGAATGGSPPSVTTLSDTKVLNTLTTAEATQLCNDTYAYFGSAIGPATICKWKGVLFATQSSAPTEEKLRSNCTAKETPCLADPGSTWASPSCSEIPLDCTKTVGDYAACIRDETASLTQKVSELPACDAFTSASWTPVWDIVGADQPVSCSFCAAYYAPDPRQF